MCARLHLTQDGPARELAREPRSTRLSRTSIWRSALPGIREGGGQARQHTAPALCGGISAASTWHSSSSSRTCLPIIAHSPSHIAHRTSPIARRHGWRLPHVESCRVIGCRPPTTSRRGTLRCCRNRHPGPCLILQHGSVCTSVEPAGASRLSGIHHASESVTALCNSPVSAGGPGDTIVATRLLAPTSRASAGDIASYPATTICQCFFSRPLPTS